MQNYQNQMNRASGYNGADQPVSSINSFTRLNSNNNFSANSQSSYPQPQKASNDPKGFINRCFEKCITVSEKLEMNKLASKAIQANLHK